MSVLLSGPSSQSFHLRRPDAELLFHPQLSTWHGNSQTSHGNFGTENMDLNLINSLPGSIRYCCDLRIVFTGVLSGSGTLLAKEESFFHLNSNVNGKYIFIKF